jgi:hypothetical protein
MGAVSTSSLRVSDEYVSESYSHSDAKVIYCTSFGFRARHPLSRSQTCARLTLFSENPSRIEVTALRATDIAIKDGGRST